ncbi:MAG: DNA-directed RNA polymerase subunit omega [Acidobacteria bacterium]|nr:MAG: DNA-directed RNA polymerase subunit omega [Acidobacteriota bacterium]
MSEAGKTENDGLGGFAGGEQWPGIDSRFRLIVVAALRSKQLQRGARPRIVADPHRRRNTSIAIEEVRQGLVPFTDTAGEPKDSDGGRPNAGDDVKGAAATEGEGRDVRGESVRGAASRH